MSREYVLKLQDDLRKKLEPLSLMHTEPALHVADHFAELKRQIDLDANRLIEEMQSVKTDTENAPKDSEVNETRLEFIRILDELEKRIGHQPKPQAAFNEVYASFEQRIDAFKDLTRSLDDLEESYIQLTREIIAETDRLEKDIFGEQTIIYLPHKNRSKLGSLVYFGDLFLCLRDIERLTLRLEKIKLEDPRRLQIYDRSYLVPVRLPYEDNNSKQVVESFFNGHLGGCFNEASKFLYVGKTEKGYSSYSAEGASVERKFLSYQRGRSIALRFIQAVECYDWSENLFNNYSSNQCWLHIEDHRLESLHANLLPSPATRLTQLVLKRVHFESFNSYLLAACTNLITLDLETTYSRGVEFDLNFLGALTKLETLGLTLPDTPSDLRVISELNQLTNLKLEGCSLYAEKLPKLSNAALEQILWAPSLETLELSGFEIEANHREILSVCRNLSSLELTRNRIGPAVGDQIVSLGFPRAYFTISIKLMHNDIRALNASSFAGMTILIELWLTGNSITHLPPGVFQDLRFLRRLDLDKNLIRHISSTVFSKLKRLNTLNLGGNLIESIEANAFFQLDNLTDLSLKGCRLKSIDSEMFNGLVRLNKLSVKNNLIERIEVVAEDGRRINVAKADLSEEEKQLVRKHLFKDLAFLKGLKMNGNKLEKLDLNCFSNLRSMSSLDLSSNIINELSGQAGPELLSELRGLNLDNNQLSEIDKKTFPKSLDDLRLSKNKLKRLDDDFFTEYTQLRVVNLAQNELTWIVTDATFARCRQCLKHIDLSQNESIRFVEGAYREMPNLRWVDCDLSGDLDTLPPLTTLRIRKVTPEVLPELQQFCVDKPQSFLYQLEACCLSGCSIKYLARNPNWERELKAPETDHFNLSWLQKASCLGELDFSRNLIETLEDPELFADHVSLTEINLSYNRLSRIHRDIFRCVSNIKIIDLSCNNLSSIDMGFLRPLAYLEHLNLSSNGISFLNLARLFRICPCLQSLNIADNQLDERSTVEHIDARTCCDLKELFLANNRLEKMDFVRDMTSLQHLNLGCNWIGSVMSNNGENLLGRLFKLTHLDLSGNQIRSLRDEMFDHVRHQLRHLDLSSNPLDIQLDSILIELI